MAWCPKQLSQAAAKYHACCPLGAPPHCQRRGDDVAPKVNDGAGIAKNMFFAGPRFRRP